MQQFEIEKDQDNLWGNIRQFRKNLKPTKSPNANSNSFLNEQKGQSTHRIPLTDLNPQTYNDSNKENNWSFVNTETEKTFKHNGEDEEQMFMINSKGTQPFHNPLSKEYELTEPTEPTEPTGYLFDSAKAAYSSRLVDSARKDLDSSLNEKDDNSFEGTDFTQTINGDQVLIQQLVEQKKKMEDDLKGAKQLVIKTRKVIVNQFQRVKAEHEKEKDDIHRHYTQMIEQMKIKHEKELKEKDEEIDALTSVISSHDESEKKNEDNNKVLEEYEDVIRSMKTEFEEELTKLSNYHKKKAQQSQEEKEQLNEEIQDLKNQLSQLQYPPTKREYAGGWESSRLELETTNRLSLMESVSNPPIQNKPKQGKEIKNLLAKINQYMDENTIENEVSITNRRDLYKEIYTVQNNKAKLFDIKPLNLAALQIGTKVKSKKKIFEESKGKGDENLDSEYFQSIMEECKKNQETSEVFSDDEEDAPRMNYTIKNLHGQLKFKPKYEDEK